MTMESTSRHCLRESIPEIAQAAGYLEEAVTAHLAGRPGRADELIRAADMPVIREWTESLWGGSSPYVRFRAVDGAPPSLPKADRVKTRMPNTAEQRTLHQRDGYHCRFCGIPVIRKEVRVRIRAVYEAALPWGFTNPSQHAAFQAMWAQYDHVLPHARGGNSSLQNTVITCAPCNFGRMNFTLEEIGLTDPRLREPSKSSWSGLEHFR
jgi:hypothetical protein